ncbi:unnamed protein product [Durusdinium trenchii]|uniref:Uncharacterized protein n=1 Tax=Durusdinium trenchii TaxID=1381693 RepID=A0ABP0KU37_9DINO
MIFVEMKVSEFTIRTGLRVSLRVALVKFTLSYARREGRPLTAAEAAEEARAAEGVAEQMAVVLEALRKVPHGLRTCKFFSAWDGGHLELLLTSATPLTTAAPERCADALPVPWRIRSKGRLWHSSDWQAFY